MPLGISRLFSRTAHAYPETGLESSWEGGGGQHRGPLGPAEGPMGGGGEGGTRDHRMKITLVGQGKGGMRDVVCNHFYADIQTAEFFTGLIIIFRCNTRMKKIWMKIFHFRNPSHPLNLFTCILLFALSRNLPEIFRPFFRSWSTVDF
jgi:hypothetical protein